MRENQGFFVACCLLGLAWVYVSYDADHENSLLATLLGVGSISTWLGLLVLAAYRIIKRDYLPWQKRLAPFWLLFTPFAITASYGYTNRLFSSPTWLLVERYDFTGSDNMLFKKNGEYQYWEHGPMGRSAIVRGRYTRHDSLLLMQPNTAASMPKIARIAIRPYTSFQRLLPTTRLVALDSRGTTLAIFRIKERNKP
jgi:hypothetical protein